MFFYRRTLGVLVSCLLAVPACAFTFSYGSLFNVVGVESQDGIVKLPLTRKKYTNVKVLSKPMYNFLQACERDCTYPISQQKFNVTEYRVAASDSKMLIVQVKFNEDLLLTVLAFKNKEKVSVKFPETVRFKDKNLQKQVQQTVLQLATDNL